MVGNVALVKAEETRVSGIAANITNPDITASTGFTLSTSSYIVTDEGLLFKVKAEGTKTGSNGQNLDGGGEVTLVGTVTTPVTTATVTDGQNVPFKGEIEGDKLTITSSNYVDSSAGLKLQFSLKEIGDNTNPLAVATITNGAAPEFNSYTTKSTISAEDTAKINALAASITTIANNAFKGVTVEGNLDLSTATTLTTIGTSAFEGATIGTVADAKVATDALKFGAATISTIGTDAFKGATINGNLDLSTATPTLTNKPFKGTDSGNKGVTIKGELKLKASTTLDANELDYVDINTLDLTGMTTTATTFTGSKFGTLTLPSDYVGVANAFDSTTITELKFGTSFSGTVAANAFAGATKGATIITLDLTNVTDDKLDNAFKASDSDFTKGATITNITNHNGTTKLGKCTVNGNVTFASSASVGTEIFKDTKLWQIN